MRVQQIEHRDRRLSYTKLIDGRIFYATLTGMGKVIEPVDEYLDYLTARGGNPRTVRSLGYDLRDFWVYLHQLGISPEQVSIDDLEDWIVWLRLPSELRFAYEQIVLLDTTPVSSDAIVSRKLSTVVGFFDYLYRVRNDDNGLGQRGGKTWLPGGSSEAQHHEIHGGVSVAWNRPSVGRDGVALLGAEGLGGGGSPVIEPRLLGDRSSTPQRLVVVR